MRLKASLVVLALAAVAASPAAANQPANGCKARAEFIKALGATYAEAPIAMGMTATGAVLEVMASDTGTWTIIVTLPNGTTCAVASGDAWQSVAGRRGPKV